MVGTAQERLCPSTPPFHPAEQLTVTALFLVISTPRPERPTEVAAQRQGFWPWIGRYEASGVCKHIYARVGRGAAAVFNVESNDQLHRILNEWADIIPAEFDVYPLVDIEATRKMLAAQVAGNKDT
jgi:muconolactone delta-isomerase